MTHNQSNNNHTLSFEPELTAIADYICNFEITSTTAYEVAHYCLLDALGCAIAALRFPECTKLLGPLVPGCSIEQGARVPGTNYELDPVQAAFNIGTTIRWLDYNDTWLAAEWGHPSDNLGALLAVSDFRNRKAKLFAKTLTPVNMRDLLTALIKAYEIQGVIALHNSFNQIGFDHVALVKLASTGLATQMLGGTKQEILNALSQAIIDGHSLRAYRHAPNTGSRKSWAAGDATARAVRLALMSLQGEMGYPMCMRTPRFGFYDVYFKGKPFEISQPYQSYVMENILFKVSFPAEFHAQTAVECALLCQKKHGDQFNTLEKIHAIKQIVIKTQEPAVRIISKTGPLYNPADRDHCLQYMVAVALIYGELTADHYEEKIAIDPRIDALRAKMQVSEDKDMTQKYYDPSLRAIPNSLQIFFNDQSQTDCYQIDFPLGHRMRRSESLGPLKEKLQQNISSGLAAKQQEQLLALWDNQEQLLNIPVDQFMQLLIVQGV